LGAITILPVFKALQHYGNPTLERFNREVIVTLSGTDCSYSPFRKAANDCERNQEFLTKNGVSYTLQAQPGEQAVAVKVGDSVVAGFRPTELTDSLKSHGWVEKADRSQVNSFMLFLLLIVPVIAVALITGPQTAVLAELFTARTRYSAAAVPHNLSAGWIGGLSPFMVTLLSVQAGDALAGLWYPVGMLILASVVGLLFLPETRDVDLSH
jgi:hypothetical protein